ncbi:MAG TPA: ATP-binding protein [Saprospiraceae bacterium]|nr:ATP-binding protein [Candidatus Parvibacillus calidus]WKZ64648.1 MAG: ATP-binding protein [Saprospiraceae bacterium]HNU17970.1 ATP-binding protein [Saprospiraceae bacterium]HQN56737.1 ATP-binding protein [Saprospiraceae bacterium]HQP75873.1 ATP-binding protein [Saprospiraceae bacterium]
MRSFELVFDPNNDNRSPNAVTLSKEFNWLANFITSQFAKYFGQDEGVKDVVACDLQKDNSTYAEFTRYYNLNMEERVVLLMAMAPHVCPQLLDAFFVKNSTYARPFSEFGGVKGLHHVGFLPTGETAVFLLSLNDIADRFRIMRYFAPEHPFIKHRILNLEKDGNSEPMLSGKLSISKEFLSILTEDKRFDPRFSSDFPANKLETKLAWDDLILEEYTLHQVEEIIKWVRLENLILENTDLNKYINPGYRALFYGPPGTGKTLTASLIGKQVGLTVYRIDLSKVVSKYIGETEKNLAAIFDQGENKNWILFFDEADALFGKRTNTTDAKDRYANQEIAYLLQRIEVYSGVTILATNLKTNLDEAFSRRFQSMIYFPLPKPDQRLRLWKTTFKGLRFADNVNLRKIATSYELAGGAITNVLRFCALESFSRDEQLVYHDDIISGIKKELYKDGKTM